MFTLSNLCSLTAFLLSLNRVSAQCEVYGIDYQNGGSYFLDVDLDVAFTLVQEFSGCQNDTANNILVDPNGDQSECSNTPLTPDYTPELVTCPITQDDMYSGEWSLLIISNNGDGDPIAYERDFSLSVGVPATTTFIPTVTATDVITPVATVLSTVTSIVTTTLLPQTSVIKELIAFVPFTLTSLPLPTITTVTDAFTTITKVVKQPSIVTSVVEATPTCVAPKPNYIPDPVAKILVTIITSEAQQLDGLTSAKFRRALTDRAALDASEKASFLSARSARLSAAAAVQKRAPDAATVTVTATDSASFITVTSTSYAATATVTQATTVLSTSTSTPPVLTVTQALFTLGNIFTKLEAAMTFTVTDWVVATATSSVVVPATITITSSTTPAAVVTACAATGGVLA